MTIGPSNEELAGVLEQMGALLVRLGEPNPYRVQAYLQAAAMIRDHDEPLTALYGAGGRKALMDLPGIGAALALHLAQYIENGRAGLHDRLLEAADPAALLARVPGLGEALARRIVAELGVTSLAELERAVQDGRLATLDGIGPRRLEALRLQLNSILHRSARRRARRVRRDLVRLAAARRRAEAQAEQQGVETAHAAEQAAGAIDELSQRPSNVIPLFPPAAA